MRGQPSACEAPGCADLKLEAANDGHELFEALAEPFDGGLREVAVLDQPLEEGSTFIEAFTRACQRAGQFDVRLGIEGRVRGIGAGDVGEDADAGIGKLLGIGAAAPEPVLEVEALFGDFVREAEGKQEQGAKVTHGRTGPGSFGGMPPVEVFRKVSRFSLSVKCRCFR